MVHVKNFLYKILRFIFSRVFIVALLIVLQAAYVILMIVRFSSYYAYVHSALIILSLIASIRVVNTTNDPAYKLAWFIPILLAPLLGGLMYLFLGGRKIGRISGKRVGVSFEEAHQDLFAEETPPDPDTDVRVLQQETFIREHAGFPVWRDTDVTYFPSGEALFPVLLEELEKAEHFIFLEYFIIQEGRFWNSVLEILKRKAEQGVDVRVVYDDVGCVVTLPYHYDRYLNSLGIKSMAFNPFIPFISARMNNRSHRKIVVIDGFTSFTGGINLADEYINERERFGYWKDTAVMLKGAASWNFTMMYLTTWNFMAKKKENVPYGQYRPQRYHVLPKSAGCVAPYASSPASETSVSTAVYYNMISKAQRYVFITTPYLIPDHELMRALCRAAENGVDVRIITPAHWDKYVVHALTQSNYMELIAAGVKIYEFTPGFIHAKSFVCDDELAVVGSINLDYRSLYLHFECAVWMYGVSAIADIKEDFLKTQDQSMQVDPAFCKSRPIGRRVLGWLLKLFAPLL